MSTPLPATGTPGDITALLTPDGILNPAGVLNADSVNDPGSATPQAALAASSDRPTARQLETDWSDAHPGGRITLPVPGAIDLWNFDVASTGLKPEHVRALEQFIRPFTLQPDMSTAVATGYASTTGDGPANFRLASRRAQAVADWCGRNGMPGVIGNYGGFLPGDDGESFARARSVHLEIPGAPPPPPVPRWKLLPGTTAAAPVAVQCGAKNTIDLNFSRTFYSLPPNGYLEGNFSFVGQIRFTFEDPQACLAIQESINVMTSAAGQKVTQQVTDQLAVRVSVSGQWDKMSTAALTAIVGSNPWAWEIGLQSQPNFLVLKSPTFSFTELAGPPNIANFSWNGAKASVQVAGQFQFAGRPGQLLTEPLAEWAAGLEIAAAEAAALAGAVAMCAAVFYLVVDAAVNADAEGLRRAGLVAQRMGFAAQLAVIITVDATDQDAGQFLSGWDDQRLSAMRNIVDQARRDAEDQVTALADQKDTRIAALRAKYSQDPASQPLRYDAVANALYQALGGVASTGPPPSLDQL